VKSRVGYFLAAIPLLGGATTAVWLALSGISELGNALSRIVVPGIAVLTLDQPGTYTVFHESESVVDGRVYVAQDIAGLRVTVTAEADGKPIPMVTPTGRTTYNFGGHSGTSMLSFDIASPGRYRVSADYAGKSGEPQTVLAIGRISIIRIVRTIFAIIGSALVGFGLALALVLTTFFRRRRIVEQARSA
jgi:hypothetical protein